jgi:hypothetical protein
MRTWIAIAMLLALAACGGEKKKEKQDFSKMDDTQACRVISKRVFECKDEVKKEIGAALKQAGEPDEHIAEATAMLDQPLPCEGIERGALDTVKTCYDDDCKKLAACMVPMVTQGAKRSGPSGGVDPAAKEAAAAPQ